MKIRINAEIIVENVTSKDEALNCLQKMLNNYDKTKRNQTIININYSEITQMSELNMIAPQQPQKQLDTGCITIYTDGGYSMQNNVGAGAYVMIDENGEIISKGGHKIQNATNNIAEITAIRIALMNLENNASATVISDSQYAIGVLSGRMNAKKNVELIEETRDIIRRKNLDINFEWVKGHAGNKYNEMCDKMCNEYAGCNLNEEYERYRR